MLQRDQLAKLTVLKKLKYGSIIGYRNIHCSPAVHFISFDIAVCNKHLDG